ncbi:glycogen-binding domain-containing protein [Flaviaesturariibacter terrae]
MALMRTTYAPGLRRLLTLLLLALLPLGGLFAQGGNECAVRNGRMYIALQKASSPIELEAFLLRYDLRDIGIYSLLRLNRPDSVLRQGWTVEKNDRSSAVLSKPIAIADKIFDPSERIRLTSAADRPAARRYGINRFRNKHPFPVQDSIVLFYLRGQKSASRVQLAGSFSNWEGGAIGMRRTDSGWVAAVKLPPGKYWYKFIVDGDWQTDNDNLQNENDGRGNINSVFFVVNHVFFLKGSTEARRVLLAGSFNDWRETELPLTRVSDGWFLPVYLSEGTHTYKFIADGRWLSDPGNPNTLPDGHGGKNSVLRLGSGFAFRLPGNPNARRVTVAGTFNAWNKSELELQRTNGGWELSYTLGPGNYEYKFFVDGRAVTDPGNPLSTEGPGKGNSLLIVSPNYTFRLKGKDAAHSVYLSGDFNGWNERSLPMRKEGSDWVFPVYLSPGKHRYKFIVDGQWIIDPANKLWENNEFGTGNSVLWVE